MTTYANSVSSELEPKTEGHKIIDYSKSFWSDSEDEELNSELCRRSLDIARYKLVAQFLN